jgi:hypothetical protein
VLTTTKPTTEVAASELTMYGRTIRPGVSLPKKPLCIRESRSPPYVVIDGWTGTRRCPIADTVLSYSGPNS